MKRGALVLCVFKTKSQQKQLPEHIARALYNN